MELPRYIHKRDGGSSSGALGLGWILAIALCGGVLIFAALGYLLVWRIKVRMQPCTVRVYAGDRRDEENPSHGGVGDGGGGGGGGAKGRRGTLSSSFTNVLSKTRLLRSESSLSKLSSSISMSNLSVWRPPVLPPLPMNNSGFLEGERRRWQVREDNGETDQGSSIRRRSWRDGWLGMMVMGTPTKRDAGGAAQKGDVSQRETAQMESNAVVEEASGPKQWQERLRNEIHVQKKRQGRPTLVTSQTAPELSMNDDDDEPPRGRSRVAAPIQRRSQPQFQAPQQPPPIHQPSKKQQQQDQCQMQQKRQQEQQCLYQHRAKSWATETDLRDILKSTDQRLRDGSSHSPVKTPRSSPTRGSPTRTPRVCRTGSSTKTAGRLTPSPSKMNLLAAVFTATNEQSRNVSISSVSSAADSLIQVATEELELPGGLSSPSRHHQENWDAPPRYNPQQKQEQEQQQTQQQPRKQKQQQQPQRRRSISLESEASSCLSTLYSVGEPDEQEEERGKMTLAAELDDDPFVETRRIHQQQLLFKKSSWETWQQQQQQQQLTGPRPLRRTQTVSARSFSTETIDESAIPAPLRTMSVNSHLGRTSLQGLEKRNSRLSLVLQPPQRTQSEDVKPKTSELLTVPQRASLSGAPSATSIVSDSAYTDVSVADSVGDSSEETIKPAEDLHKRGGSSVSTATTATNNGWVWNRSSSTLTERELFSMMTQGTQPKRDLPMPPSRITLNDETIMPAPLSPLSKNKQYSPPLSKRASVLSTSSSNYDQTPINSPGEDKDNGSDPRASLPSRRVTSSSLSVAFRGAAHSVGNSVAELRRMNSMVSSYSVASMASFFSETLAESSTLTSLRGGGFSPATEDHKAEAAGKRNYLNLGGSPVKDKGKKRSSMSQAQQQQQQSPQGSPQQRPQRPQSGHRRTQSRWSIPVLLDNKDRNCGKENQAPNLRTVRFDIPSGVGLGSGRPVVSLPPPSRSPTRNTRDMTAMHVKRSSADSLGLYDKDGFLKSSPERDAMAKAGRLRM